MRTISICVIAFNEEKFISNLLKDIESQLYPHEFTEVVLVDSASTDATKEIMSEFKRNNTSFWNVQVLDNPKRIQAAGWNVAITHAKGDVISRIDSHSHLTPEFSKYVMEDIDTGEYIVGGIRPCVIEKNTKWSRTLLAAENSLFGSSINKSRRSNEKQYVDSMFHASYRKEVFKKVGLFNESLLRTEDNELHYRMRQAGFKLLYDPRIVSYQYSRNNMRKMIKQKYANGYWIGKTVSVCPGCLSWYHFVPAIFVLSVLISILLSVIGFPVLLLLLGSLYSLFCLINTYDCFQNDKGNVFIFFLPAIYFLLHCSYGVGTIKAFFRG